PSRPGPGPIQLEGRGGDWFSRAASPVDGPGQPLRRQLASGDSELWSPGHPPGRSVRRVLRSDARDAPRAASWAGVPVILLSPVGAQHSAVHVLAMDRWQDIAVRLWRRVEFVTVAGVGREP